MFLYDSSEIFFLSFFSFFFFFFILHGFYVSCCPTNLFGLLYMKENVVQELVLIRTISWLLRADLGQQTGLGIHT